jgi:hypothetical protein
MPKLSAAVLIVSFLIPRLFCQEEERPRAWLPPLMENSIKLSPDRMVDDEDPAMARDTAGRIWVAWYSCRTASAKLPGNKVDLREWQWPDDGKDSVVARWFDGRNWSSEQVVSDEPGVNWRPAIVPDEDGVRVLWTSRRGGKWAAYEKRWSKGRWEPESRVPASENALEVRAARLSDGSLLAVMKKLAPPRIELEASVRSGGVWRKPLRLDQAQGRCHRASILPLGGSNWMVAWDEERGGNYDIWVRPPGSPAVRITDSELWDTTPTLAKTSDGRVWLAWERKETIGGRFAYRARSVFGKIWDGANWSWAPSPYIGGDPGRLTRHSRFWATEGISEERYPRLEARSNGDLWLFWMGGGRDSSTSFAGRVWKNGKWSEPRMVFYDPVPYSAFALPSAKKGVDFRTSARGPYQTPLYDQMSFWLDDQAGMLSLAYEVPKRRHTTDRMEDESAQPRPAGYGADIYFHRVDLDEREFTLTRVVDDETPIPALTTRPYRPTVPRTLEINGAQYHLVFGDLHGHTENDALGTVDMYYTHGLFIAGMDFLASTNHDYSPNFLTQSEWAATQALASVYNGLEGRVAFSGWEWTTEPADARGGHRAMYFLTDTGELHRSTTVGSNTVEKLYKLLRGQDVILQPHHNGWEGYDPKLQPVLEVTSAWRQLREESKDLKSAGKVQSAWEALERGYRIGFVGSGDTHWLGPGEDFGITGAYVKELTREGVFEAIRARRVFASTGARMLLNFSVNDAFMGREATANGAPRISVDVTGDADIEKIEIVRDHRIVHAVSGAGKRSAFQFIDQNGNPESRRASYYYVRISQKDGMKAWSSPVWLRW